MNLYEREVFLQSLPDEALSQRSQALHTKIVQLKDKIEPAAIQERTIPALSRLQDQTDRLYLDREVILPLSPQDLSTKCEGLLKGRKDINRVARALISTQSLGEIAQKAFGEDNEANRDKTEIWLNTIQMYEFQQQGLYLERKESETGEISYNLSEKRKRSQLDTSIAPKKEKLNDSTIPEKKLEALHYIATTDSIHLDKLLDLMGETKANRKMTWAQAAASLRFAVKLLSERISKTQGGRKNKPNTPLTENEIDIWNKITEKVQILEEDSVDEKPPTFSKTASLFREYLTTVLDPRINPQILWPSNLEEDSATTEAEDYKEAIINSSEKEIGEKTEDTTEAQENVEAISEEAFAEISLALFRCTHIKLQTKEGLVDFSVPEELRQFAKSFLDYYKQDLTSMNINPEVISYLKTELSDCDKALLFIEKQEHPDLQEILFWLESKKDFIFELLAQLPVKGEKKSQLSLEGESAQNSEGVVQNDSKSDTDQEKYSQGGVARADTKYDIESIIVDIRDLVVEKSALVFGIPMLATPSYVFQITGAIRGISISDIRRTMQQKFIKHQSGSGRKDILTTEDVVMILLFKELSKKYSFTSAQKRDLIDIVQEEMSNLRKNKNQTPNR